MEQNFTAMHFGSQVLLNGLLFKRNAVVILPKLKSHTTIVCV